MKLENLQDIDKYLHSSVAISNHNVKIIQDWFSFPVTTEKDKKEPHSWDNKINPDSIKFYFFFRATMSRRKKKKKTDELNSRVKIYCCELRAVAACIRKHLV